MNETLTNDISSRVEIIKHLQAFIDTTLFDEDAGPVGVYLEEKFKSYAKNELAILLGMASSQGVDTFTPEQIIALKVFADRIIGGRNASPGNTGAVSVETPTYKAPTNGGESSKGKTEDFESSYLGSNPSSPTNNPPKASINDFAKELAKSKKNVKPEPKAKSKNKPTPKPEPKKALISLKPQSGLQKIKAKANETTEDTPKGLPSRKKTGKVVEVELTDNQGRSVRLKRELEDHSQVKPSDPSIMKPMPGKHEFETMVNANAAMNAQYNQSFATQKLSIESGANVGVASSAIQNRINVGVTRNVQEETETNV